jgi:hypothetical protein
VSKPFKGFSHFNEAWYQHSARLPDVIDSVSIGWYYDGGGCDSEFNIQWKELGGKPVPQLQMFDDSWECFKSMPKLFAALAAKHDKDINPAELCELLLSLGFRDITDRESPYFHKAAALVASAKSKLTPEELAALLGSAK